MLGARHDDDDDDYCYNYYLTRILFVPSKSPQVHGTLFSILSDLNNKLVWIVSKFLLISESSSPSTNPLVTVVSAPIKIGITVTFMFHSCVQFASKI